MVELNGCLHPLEGIVLAAVLYALYYGVIRLKCQARKAQAYILVAVLSVTISTFISLSLVVETEKTTYIGHTAQQVDQPSDAGQNAVAENNAALPPTSTRDATWRDAAWLQPSNLLVWLYAAGAGAVAISFLVQILWLWRIRKNSSRETEDDGTIIFSSRNGIPFSFFNSVFLPSDLEGDTRQHALMHEKCHIRHHHFLKLCIMLLLVALNWFNPFVWLFFSEMKMQQELEVDSDMLTEGIDRQSYQMSLLQVCIKNSRWLMVQSGFGSKSLKQRIIFMNKTIKRLPSLLRLSACLLGLILLWGTTMAVRAQISFVSTHHPLEGCWTMDFTRPANTTKELYPPFKQYAFYNHDTFFTPHFYQREGINFYFGYSGEEVMMRGDTLVNAHGEAMVYRFVADNTFQCDWKKSSTDNSLAQGEVITDQWSRATPPAEMVKAFQLACDAGQQKTQPFDGVWQQPSDKGDQTEHFLLVNGNVMVALDYIPDPDRSIYRYSGGGICTEIKAHNDTIEAKWMKATIIMEGNDQAVMHQEGNDHTTRLKRTSMPPYIHRMLATTKTSMR